MMPGPSLFQFFRKLLDRRFMIRTSPRPLPALRTAAIPNQHRCQTDYRDTQKAAKASEVIHSFSLIRACFL